MTIHPENHDQIMWREASAPFRQESWFCDRCQGRGFDVVPVVPPISIARINDPMPVLSDFRYRLKVCDCPHGEAIQMCGDSLAEGISNDLSPSEVIGDRTCVNNTQSRFLRCVVNPHGPCEGCKDYEAIAK